MLVQNTFDNLMDSSLGVTYGVADIQGNTFEKLTGKPFVDMRPMIETVSILMSHLTLFTARGVGHQHPCHIFQSCFNKDEANGLKT